MILKNIIKKIILGRNTLRKPSVTYCAHHSLLPSVIVRTPCVKLRQLLLLPQSMYETQLNQDIFALLVNRFKTGFFVEIGANDGFTLSNTVYLEEQFGWEGLLVEANPQYHDSLKNRKSKSVIAAVVEQEGFYEFCNAGLYGGIVRLLDKTHEKKTRNANNINIWGTTLAQILEENNAPNTINFISIDVEGAEVPIVEQMCKLRKYRFMCGCIEYNGRQPDYQQIKNQLSKTGYRIVWEGQTIHDLFFIDDRGLSGDW